METLQTILLTILIVTWLSISIALLVSMIQSVIYDRNHEKRMKAQDARDLEYHVKRMNDFK